MNLIKLFAIAIILLGVPCIAAQSAGQSRQKPLYFEITDLLANPLEAPKVEPWVAVELDSEYGGRWVVAGDLDGDGNVEIVSAKIVHTGRGPHDNHYTSSISVQKLDGSILWRWGNPQEGRRLPHGDVACQIYDWNGDGKNEVLVASEKSLLIFEGKTGKVLRDYPIPTFKLTKHALDVDSPDIVPAADCIIACNLTGASRAMDFILKGRYEYIFALSAEGELLWKSEAKPGGYYVGHNPLPVDITGDGKDELFCGYFMLNSDGSLRWTVSGSNYEPHKYLHMDSHTIIKEGKTPEEWLIAFTYCVGNGLGIVNGLGEIQKEVVGNHYESVRGGNIFPLIDTPHLITDIDHLPEGEGVVDVFDANLNLLGRINVNYGRYHELADWDGDGYDDIIVGDNASIYNYKGQKIAQLNINGDRGRTLQARDFTGNGLKDILLVGMRMDKVYIFKNQSGKPCENTKQGTGKNFSFY